MSNIPEKELIKLCRNPETRNYGFNILVKSYQEKIYWLIRRIVIDHEDSNDITQNVFIKVWKNLDNFREEAKLYSWIYRIATNEALAFLKQKRTLSFLPFHDVKNKLSQSLYDTDSFSGNEIQIKLHKAILKLPDKQRIVFNMKYFDEITYEQMSEILDTSVGSLKASFHFAVKKIEKFLTED